MDLVLFSLYRCRSTGPLALSDTVVYTWYRHSRVSAPALERDMRVETIVVD